MNMPDFTRKSTLAIMTLALTAMLSAAPAVLADDAARPGVVRTQVVVDYADLDLGSVAGNKALYARLSHAAERACGPEPERQDLRARSDYRQCREAALAKAVDRIDSPELQALHARQSADGVG
jgi:UrcA family protein